MAIERGTVIDGKYEILKEIGRGGMSVVYLAMDNRLNKQWAVKVLQRQGIGKNGEVVINKVPDDTELMKRLDHPAIPRIVDIIDRPDDPQIYIVMDYVEGESLDKILKEFGAQPQELVIDWSKQICDTLSYLHSQKPPIIYRDMKPANIMLKPEGNVKLIDFGIAREYKEQSLADTTALGTRGYASPEHFGGRTDARSDIYTLGMTMHHLLTGVDPRSKNYEYFSIREYNPELSDGLEYIIDKCTSWDPEDRYQNCNELMYDLENYTILTRDFKKKQKRKLITFIASIALCVVFAILGLVFNSMVNNRYEILSTSSDIEQVYKAIEIDNGKPDAYLKAMDLYKSEFKKEQLSRLTNAIDNTNLNKTSKEYFDLKYQFGYLILFNYSDDKGINYSERLNRASNAFKEIVDNDTGRTCSNYANAELYKSMYDIYSSYEVDHEDPTKETLETLITSFESIISQTKESDANVYAKATNLVEIFNMTHKYDNPCASCGVDKSTVKAVFDDIYNEAQSLKNQTVSTETTEILDEITDNYENYLADLDRAYTNAERGN